MDLNDTVYWTQADKDTNWWSSIQDDNTTVVSSDVPLLLKPDYGVMKLWMAALVSLCITRTVLGSGLSYKHCLLTSWLCTSLAGPFVLTVCGKIKILSNILNIYTF